MNSQDASLAGALQRARAALSLALTEIMVLPVGGERDIRLREMVENATPAWQAAVRIIGHTLNDLKGPCPDLGMGLCARRIEALARRGALEARGGTDFMRLCQIRLPTSSLNVAN